MHAGKSVLFLECGEVLRRGENTRGGVTRGGTIAPFATDIHFHPSLIFVGKSWSLLLEWGTIRGFTLVGFRLAYKYWTRVEKRHTIKIWQQFQFHWCHILIS